MKTGRTKSAHSKCWTCGGKKLDFFPALKAKAAALKNGEGLHIIQTFEPVPLYPVLTLMGFERHTEKVSGSKYHVWFYRVRKGE